MRFSLIKITQFLTFFIIISTLFLCFLSSPLMALPPAYDRLQPVTDEMRFPTDVAIDANEWIYVTESSYNRLNVYSPGGQFIKRLSGLQNPFGVTVDSSGRIFVGNAGKGNVEVYDTDFTLLFKLGSGDNEFVKPISIETDSADNIYVADFKGDIIKVYNPDGSFNFSFGGTGTGNGQFNFPTSIAIDEVSGEILVSDHQFQGSWKGSYQGARIQIFDMSGVYIRSFGTFGTGEGKLTKPMGVAVDGEGRIYVTDAFQNIVEVFDSIGTYLGAVYDLNNPMQTPLGIAMSISNKLYIVSHTGRSIEIYGIDSYTSMVVTPQSLFFEEFQDNPNLLPQNLDIINNGTLSFNWTASASDPWITLSATSGSTVPGAASTISVGIDITGLTQGSYEGTVEITADTGAVEVVDISLTITAPPVLSVAPSELSYASVNSSTPLPQAVSIDNTGQGTLNWTASVSSSWILLDKNTGTAPDTINVSVDVSGLSEGIYTGNINITSEGATGSPATVAITLNITVDKGTINVITNLDTATFIINGPASYSGSGTIWTVTDAPIGTYIIIYGDVEGYITPPGDTQTLLINGTITFTGDYAEDRPVFNSRNIIIGAGAGESNPGLVKVFNSDGTPAGVEFIAHPYTHGVNIASGDVDNDGYDDIITAPGPGADNPAEINIFDRYGNLMPGLSFTAFSYNYGVNLASADFDGDGHYEIVAGAGAGNENHAHVKVFIYDLNSQTFTDSGINFLPYGSNKRYGVHVTTGDVDGDGIPEIITTPGPASSNEGDIRIWKVNTSAGIGQWSTILLREFPARTEYKRSVTIASADINGDSYDEIITGDGPAKQARDVVSVYDEYGTRMEVWQAGTSFNGYGAQVASGDIDMDGVAEILVAPGPGPDNTAIVKIFDAYGIEKYVFYPFNLPYGANIAVGRLGFEAVP